MEESSEENRPVHYKEGARVGGPIEGWRLPAKARERRPRDEEEPEATGPGLEKKPVD